MPAVVFDRGTIRVPATGAPLKERVPLAVFKDTKTHGKHWVCPAPDAHAVVQWADEHHLSVDPKVRQAAEDGWARELRALSRSRASVLPDGDPALSITGLTATLLDTQKVVIAAAAESWVRLPGMQPYRGLLDADAPGLGKTLSALGAIRVTGLEARRALVVCPTSLTENWRAEMGEHFTDGTFTAWIAQGQTPTPIPADVDTVVIGWEILSHWADTLIGWAPDALVADEGQYAKAGRQRTITEKVAEKDEEGKFLRDAAGNIILTKQTKTTSGSARSTAILNLGNAVAKKRGFIMALTGTPVVNRPVELEPLLDLIGIVVLFGSATAYKNRYCGPEIKTIRGRKVTEYKGASNLLELNARLGSSGHYVRRTKEVLVDLGLLKRKYVDGVYCYDYTTPPTPWIVRPTADEMRAYTDVRDDMQDFFAERMAEIAAQLHSSVTAQKVQQKMRGEGRNHLAKIAELRQAAARVKAPYIIEKVREMNARGERVVIAAHHREIVDLYADAFSGIKIQGGMGVKAIEEAKRLFNTRPIDEHPVLVLSVEAGKTGHTLCKQALHDVGPECAYMTFAEQVWTPGDETQAQDRIWRIGQSREVRIINALLADSIDLTMYKQRQDKHKIVNAVIDAVNPDEAQAAKDGAGLIALQLALAA